MVIHYFNPEVCSLEWVIISHIVHEKDSVYIMKERFDLSNLSLIPRGVQHLDLNFFILKIHKLGLTIDSESG